MDKNTRELEGKKIQEFDAYQKKIEQLREKINTLIQLEIEPAYETLELSIGNKTKELYVNIDRKAYKTIKKILLEHLEDKLTNLEEVQKMI